MVKQELERLEKLKDEVKKVELEIKAKKYEICDKLIGKLVIINEKQIAFIMQRNEDFLYKNYIALHSYNQNTAEYKAYKDNHVLIDDIKEIREITKEEAFEYLTKPIVDILNYIR